MYDYYKEKYNVLKLRKDKLPKMVLSKNLFFPVQSLQQPSKFAKEQ